MKAKRHKSNKSTSCLRIIVHDDDYLEDEEVKDARTKLVEWRLILAKDSKQCETVRANGL